MDGDRSFPPPKRGMRNTAAGLASIASRQLATHLRGQGSLTVRIALDAKERGAVTLPAPAVQALHSTLGHLAKGNSVRIVALPAEYSVKEAAELLGLPPKFVLREIDAGRLRFRQAGRQKRVGADDLEAYRVRLQKRRRRALHELTALSQRMKLEY